MPQHNVYSSKFLMLMLEGFYCRLGHHYGISVLFLCNKETVPSLFSSSSWRPKNFLTGPLLHKETKPDEGCLLQNKCYCCVKLLPKIFSFLTIILITDSRACVHLYIVCFFFCFTSSLYQATNDNSCRKKKFPIDYL